MTSPVGLTDHERALLMILLERRGRVLTRTHLARDIGMNSAQARRIDILLVNVRRELTASGHELINVRSRGWMVSAVPEASTLADSLVGSSVA